jgi:hypothetical protein
MPDDPTENTPWREGGRYGETHHEEVLDPEEAERRITQFVTSADELPGPPVEDLAEQVAALMRAAWTDLETVMEGLQQGASHATLAGPAGPRNAA